MKIYVDADACPVTRIVEKLAKRYEISCALLCDTNHVVGRRIEIGTDRILNSRLLPT